MRILIDGYNLIRRIPELKEFDKADLDGGREYLLRELAAYSAGKNHRIMVVFDGAHAIHLGGSVEKVRGITVYFSPRGSSADQLILEYLRNDQADVLISGDRELTDAARRGETTPISPELFWNKVQDEMYRRMKGEEEQEQGGGRIHRHQGYGGQRARGTGGRKLSKVQKRDRSRIEKL